jgi:predicted N-acetyltransferase YhbS
MDIRDMRPGERDALLDLLQRAFESDAARFERRLDAPAPLAARTILVAVEGDKLVGCVWLFARRARLRRSLTSLGGIGNVATDPGHQGRGIGSQLVAAAMQRLREEGHPIGLLFTSRFGFYERLGWRQVSQRLFRLRADGMQPRAESSLRSFTPEDLESVRELYDRYTETLSGVTVRDADVWRALLAHRGPLDDELLLAEQRGSIVAYAWSEDSEGRRRVLEYARAHGAAEELVDLLIARTPAERSLYAPMVPDPELGHALRTRGCSPAPTEDASPMWCVLERSQLAEIASLPLDASDRSILDALVGGPTATYWESDRF